MACPYCDDTGDVIRADGEYLGVCHCQAGNRLRAIRFCNGGKTATACSYCSNGVCRELQACEMPRQEQRA